MHNIYNKLAVYISVSLIIAVYFYLNVDIPFNDYVVTNRSESVKGVFDFLTELGNAKYSYAVIILLFIMGFFIKNPMFKIKTQFAFISMLSASVIVQLAKFIIGRSRPKLWIYEGKYEFNPFPGLSNTYDYASMPSGHTQASFTVALILALLFPKYRYIFILGAIIIGFSRVMVSAHWLSDIVMGAVFGSVVPILIYHHFYRDKINQPPRCRLKQRAKEKRP